MTEDRAEGPDSRLPGMTRRSALLLGGGATAGALVATAAMTFRPGSSTISSPSEPPGGTSEDGAPLGVVAVERFRSGAMDDDATLAAAMRYAAAQTYKPALAFANRAYDLTRPVRPFSGLHLLAFPFGEEFRHSQSIKLPAGGLLAFDPEVRSITLENLSCNVRDHLLEPIPSDGSRGAWTDTRILGGGYNGGSTLISGAVLRLAFHPVYVNNVSDSLLRIGGSDCWLFTRGPHYVSGTLPPDRPFLDLQYLGQSVIGSAYITAQGGYGVSIGGEATGLVLDGTLIDASGRTGDQATQLAGLQITGGNDITVNDLWVFNANVSGESAGLVTVTGGADIVFNSPRFPGANGAFPSSQQDSPCIHTTVPITVIAPKATGRAKVITASEPDLVTLVGAPGWEVRVV